jgi:hypothetical protein
MGGLLDVAAAQLPMDVGADRTLVAVLGGNLRLAGGVSEGVARACVKMVARTGRQARWLAPLHELLSCRGAYVKRNQVMVFKASAPRESDSHPSLGSGFLPQQNSLWNEIDGIGVVSGSRDLVCSGGNAHLI